MAVKTDRDREFPNIYILQGSVATHFRRDGIHNDQCITRSLQSLKVINICRSYWQEWSGCFFWTQCI